MLIDTRVTNLQMSTTKIS